MRDDAGWTKRRCPSGRGRRSDRRTAEVEAAVTRQRVGPAMWPDPLSGCGVLSERLRGAEAPGAYERGLLAADGRRELRPVLGIVGTDVAVLERRATPRTLPGLPRELP